MHPRSTPDSWGTPPWVIDFVPQPQVLPAAADIAVVGGGFTGLAAAAWLRRLAPRESVVVLEASRIGAGASGRTGGIVLSETASGDLPGLGDVLAGFTNILEELDVQCDLSLGGAWEIGRSGGLADSPIRWNDSGTVCVVKEVPGGRLDPGKLVSGLARAAQRLGVMIIEDSPTLAVRCSERVELRLSHGDLSAGKVLFATNALSLGLTGLHEGMHPRLALAVESRPHLEEQLAAIGLSRRKPFYTVDLPYLWGCVQRDNSIVWGAGLVQSPDSGDLERVDITLEEPSQIFASLEERIRRLNPALGSVEFSHRWGGPILFRDGWQPVFSWHANSRNAIVLGAYAGHGVALSSYLGAWAAEALLGKRELPDWGAL
jgi:glycine/D-amino acid oxidase-like deaminating enzyme